MKKTLQFLLLMLLAGTVQAQYFHAAYGTLGGVELLTDGESSRTGMPGHLVTGTTNFFGGIDMVVGRLNAQGNIAGSGFLDANRLLLNGVTQMNSAPVEVLHTPTDQIIVVGTATLPNQPEEYTYIHKMGGNGALLSAIGFGSSNFKNATPTAATLSLYDPNVVYVTGYVRYSNVGAPGTYVFLLAYDFVNNLVVSDLIVDLIPGKVYDNIPTGIICSPYSNEVVIVGNHNDLAGTEEVFFMTFDQYVNWTGVLSFYDNRGRTDNVTGITWGQDGSGGSKGFVICGNTDEYTGSDWQPWIFKVDPAGTLLWSHILPYSTGYHTEVHDVVERINTNQKFEYYLVGTTKVGNVAGDVDVVVYKTDESGMGIGEFTYGGQGDQLGIALGLVQGTADDGLGIYGREYGGFITGGRPDFYVIKTYYDGATACNDKINSANTVRAHTGQYYDQISRVDILKDFNVRVRHIRRLVEFPYCSAASIPGASNARESGLQVAAGQAAFVAPNPVAEGQAIVLFSEYAETQTIQLRLMSMEGRVLSEQSLVVMGGAQQTDLRFDAELAAGMYLLQVQAKEGVEVLRLIVE